MDSKIKLLSPQQVAELLGISPRTVHGLCNEGRLGYVMVNKRARAFTPEQVQEYIEAQTVYARIARKPRPVPQPVKKGEPKDQSAEVTVVDRASLRREMRKW
jgi:excisionase family DNA binding protein